MFRQLYTLILLMALLLINSTAYTETRISKLDFVIIPMHDELLKSRAYVWQEYEQLTSFELLNNVEQGSKQINLTAPAKFNHLELVVYRSTSGQYHITQVEAVNETTVTLSEPLQEGISQGANLWNFYHDASHPNEVGYKALADFALSHLNQAELQNKLHLFVGDSWLASKTLESRLIEQIDGAESINKAVHGRRSIDVLNALDADIGGIENPDYVWITLGTNDYWLDVSAKEYIQNMEAIIRKINNLGAQAIVFDSSVGPLEWDESLDRFKTIRRDLSDNYSSDLARLAEENNTSRHGSNASAGVLSIELLMLMGFLGLRKRHLFIQHRL